MDEHTRRTLAELFAADDKWRAEHEDWLARRNAESIPPPVRENDGGAVLYRTTDQNAQASPQTAAPTPSSADDGGGLFGDWRDDMLARALGTIIAEMRAEREAERSAEQGERNAELAKLQTEIDELRGKINAILTLMGAASATKMLTRARDDGVIDLPDWRKRHA